MFVQAKAEMRHKVSISFGSFSHTLTQKYANKDKNFPTNAEEKLLAVVKELQYKSNFYDELTSKVLSYLCLFRCLSFNYLPSLVFV